MKANFISKEGIVANFDMTFTPEEFEIAIEYAYQANKGKFQVDGFRKGKAPRKMIENFYGADIFYDDALNKLLIDNYTTALDELDLEVINSPVVRLTDFERGNEVTINISVECYPEVQLDNYKGLEIEEVISEVTEADIDQEIERVRKTQTRLETVEGRPAQMGDTVIIDFAGSIDGEYFTGGSGANFELHLGSGQFIPGFEEQLVGHNVEDKVLVEVTFPDDYQAEALAGKPAVFETTIHEIKEETLPPVDDDFASDVSEFETLAEYRVDVRRRLEESAKARDLSHMKNRVAQKLVEINEVDTPEVMINDEIDGMLNDLDAQLGGQGLTLAQYLEFIGQTEDEIREEARADAKRSVDMGILMRAVIRQENISVSEEEFEEGVAEIAKLYGMESDKLKEMFGPDNLRYIEEELLRDKVVDFLFENAVIVPKPEVKEETAVETEAE